MTKRRCVETIGIRDSFSSVHYYVVIPFFSSLTDFFCDSQEVANVSADKSGEAKDTKK